jgi:hypothetical protein
MRQCGSALGLLLLITGCFHVLFPRAARAQNNPAAKTSDATAAQPEPGSLGLGFSMESEMLTYAAMEHNSRAIACDVATYIYREQEETHRAVFTFAAGTSKPVLTDINTLDQLCEYAKWYADAQEQPQNSIRNDGIVILQASSTIQSDLELWRTYMAEMESLYQAEAKQVAGKSCGANSKEKTSSPRFGSPRPLEVRLDLDDSNLGTTQLVSASSTTQKAAPEGNIPGTVDLAEQVVSANESSEAVRGTVESQTFVNTIAGWLRVLGIPVLIPETSMPHSLSNRRQYRILQEAEKLRDISPCLVDGNGKPTDPQLSANVNAFLMSVFGWSAVTDGTADKATFSFSNSGSASNASSSPNVVRLLSADLLAQQLNIGPAGGGESNAQAGDEGQWRHILWVRALESGGSVIKRERFWGSKIRYSGGSIVTYALGTLNGPLECSGSFHDYGGPLAAGDFYKKKDHLTLEAGIPLFGGCRALVERQAYSGVHQH